MWVNIKGKFHPVPSVPWSSCENPNGIPNPGSSSHGEGGKVEEIKVLDARNDSGLLFKLGFHWKTPENSTFRRNWKEQSYRFSYGCQPSFRLYWNLYFFSISNRNICGKKKKFLLPNATIWKVCSFLMKPPRQCQYFLDR